MKEILPTPNEIIAALDINVHGQNNAKRVLARAVYNHYLTLALTESGESVPQFGKQNILLVGPTGSGKTYLVKSLCEFLDVPFVFVSAANLTSEGYVGEGISDVLSRIDSSIPDRFKRRRAIVLLDEFDKLSMRHAGPSNSTGRNVQQDLLTALDGNVISKADQGTRNSRAYSIDTSSLLFIMTGAFVGLDELVAERNGKRSFGFDMETKRGKSQRDDVQSDIQGDDIVEFGFIPEIMGRIGSIGVLDQLAESDLITILQHSRNSVIGQQEYLFGLHGISIRYEPDALSAIAQAALKKKLGARALTQITNQCVKSVDYRLNELYNEGIRTITITADVISGGEPSLSTNVSSDYQPNAQLFRRRAFSPIDKKIPFPTAEELEVAINEARDDRLRAEQETEQACLILKEPAKNDSVIETPKEKAPSLSISNTSGWTAAEIEQRYAVIKVKIDHPATTGSALKWWGAFEEENKHRLALVLRLAEELAGREATITEFFLAYVYSNTENIQANLHYLDYITLKKKKLEYVRIPSISTEDLTALQKALNYQPSNYNHALFWPILESTWQSTSGYFKDLEKLAESGIELDDLISECAACDSIYPQTLQQWIEFSKLAGMTKKNQSKWHRAFWGILKHEYVRDLHRKFNPGSGIRSHGAAFVDLPAVKSEIETLDQAIEVACEELGKSVKVEWREIPAVAVVCTLSNYLDLMYSKILPPTGEGISKLSKLMSCQVEDQEIVKLLLKYGPHPSNLTPGGIQQLVLFIQDNDQLYGNLSSYAEQLWGPGPWA